MIGENLVESHEDDTLSAMMALGQAAGIASVAVKAVDQTASNETTDEPEIIVEAELVTASAVVDGAASVNDEAVFKDAILSDEDECKFLLHCAVKYGDQEDVQKELSLIQNKDASNINVTDSQGRTAMDLAALTGQLEIMTLIGESGGSFAFGPRPKMKAVAKKRASQCADYLQQVQASLE